MTHAATMAPAVTAAPPKTAPVSSPSEPTERAAEALAWRAVRGERIAPPLAIAHSLDRTRIHRQAAEAPAPAGGLLVEDDQTPSAGQMRKNAFLDELYTTLCRTVESGFEGTPYEGRGCPFLEQSIASYRDRPAADGEALLRRWAGDAVGVTTASGYIPIIEQRVRRSVEVYVATGEITGVPPELVSAVTGGGILGGFMSGGLSGGIASALGAGLSRLFFKGRSGATPPVADPSTVRARLGAGRGLDSRVQGRMEKAFGWSFAHVRIHDDDASTRVAQGLSARAFTVGHDVAFAPGEYRPGTLAGDALIAHELAHVVQQGPGTAGAPAPALEADADEAAASAVLDVEAAAPARKKRARPRRRAGLQLLRCAAAPTPPATAPPATAPPAPPAPPAPCATPGNVRDVPVQPVFFRNNAADPAPTGGSFARRMQVSRDIWGKLGVTFSVSAPVTLDDATRKVQGANDAELISIVGARTGPGVEVFVVDNDIKPRGGAATLTTGAPGPNSQTVLSDRGKSNTLLAHEMGHVLGLNHPGRGTPTDGEAGTIMQGTGSKDVDNSPRNTLLNAQRITWPAGAATCITPDP